MTTQQALAAEYLAWAEKKPARLQSDYQAIVQYMKHCTAIHHGEYVRTCYCPKIFTEAQFETFAADIKILYGIFAKVMDAYYRDEAYRALFGFDPVTEELILRADPTLSLLPMARIDFFYREDTGEYKFCEFNTDGSSAMNEDRELHNAQKQSAGYGAFCAAHKTRSCELFDSWVDTLTAIYQRRNGTEQLPYVAIADYMECGTVNEFEIFKQHFLDKGIKAEICDVRDLRYDRNAEVLVGPAGHKIDAIYRRAVTSDVLAHYADSGDFLAAVRDGAVLPVGDFHTQLVHNKTIFRVLHAPETFAILTPEERAYIEAHVPQTKTFEAEDRRKIISHKDDWILKPLDSYGSRGVHAGVEVSQKEWEEIVSAAPTDGSYLLQEFYSPYVTENYGFSGETFGKHRYYNLTGVYVYDGVAQGIYSRVSLSPIISSQYSEKTLPTLLVQE